VELAALRDPGLVPQAVAAPLGVREERDRLLPATLTDALRPKRVLLVLDNCEHVVDACARLADGLLRACPRLTVLATSREALGLAGETAYRVPSLALPDPAHPPPVGALGQSEAVALFLDRAQAVQPRFAVTAASARRWWRSAPCWTASPWPLSWPPPGCGRSRWTNSWPACKTCRAQELNPADAARW
jgi:non-specific serine/threonine protein kinase